MALAEPDPDLLSLTVEVASQVAPDLLLPHWRARTRAPSARARRATWFLALRSTPTAREYAQQLAYDEQEPAAIRASALCALGQLITTTEIAPLLALAIRHPDRTLAEVAAQLLWHSHRHSLPAEAALASPYPFIREVGRYLLDPHTGSPAAGGSRPGMPTL